MRVTLYTKPHCHLCDALKYELLDLQAEFGCEFVEQNVAEDAELYRTYRFLVPCVEIEWRSATEHEVIRLEPPVSQVDLRRQIKRAVQAETAPERT